MKAFPCTSSNGNIFCVTGPLWGEFTADWWIPLTKGQCKGQWRGPLVFSLICAWINGWVNNREAGDLRHHRAHCDIIVMPIRTPERFAYISTNHLATCVFRYARFDCEYWNGYDNNKTTVVSTSNLSYWNMICATITISCFALKLWSNS